MSMTDTTRSAAISGRGRRAAPPVLQWIVFAVAYAIVLAVVLAPKGAFVPERAAQNASVSMSAAAPRP